MTVVVTPTYCAVCGDRLLDTGGELRHRATGLTDCTPRIFGTATYVEDKETEVLQSALQLVYAFRRGDIEAGALPPAALAVLDRADALYEAYDPHPHTTRRIGS